MIERLQDAFAQRGLTWTNHNLFDSDEVRQTLVRIAQSSVIAPFSVTHQGMLKRTEILNAAVAAMRHGDLPDVIIGDAGDAGTGLFAAAALAPGTFIGEYTGRIRILAGPVIQEITDHNDYLFSYGMLGPFDYQGTRSAAFIDAELTSNHCRFVNHSFRPNCASGSVLLEDGWHIFLVTNTAVDAGEQLAYNYGAQYWQGRPKPVAI